MELNLLIRRSAVPYVHDVARAVLPRLLQVPPPLRARGSGRTGCLSIGCTSYSIAAVNWGGVKGDRDTHGLREVADVSTAEAAYRQVH
jgi:hypothetical protein